MNHNETYNLQKINNKLTYYCILYAISYSEITNLFIYLTCIVNYVHIRTFYYVKIINKIH